MQAATRLPSRPFLHNTSLLLAAVALCFLLLRPCRALPWVLLVAGLTHQLRDGLRRGLWLPPLGSTAPVPVWVYAAAVLLLGWLVRVLHGSGAASKREANDIQV